MTYNKYRNKPQEEDGIKFASKAETRRYQELKLLIRAGEITDLETHPSFVLQEAWTDKHGNAHSPIIYKADFMYKDKEKYGRTIVEDVKGGKGTQTPVFKLKIKLLLFKYQDIEFVIVEM